MRYLSIFIFLINLSLQSKECECINEFNEIRQIIETNHPSYQLNFKDNVEYKNFADSIGNIIKSQSSNQDCFFYLKEYLSIFNDYNLNISPNYSRVTFDENNKNDIFSLQNSSEYKSTETINIDTAKFSLEFTNKLENSIEGYYTSSDNKTKVAIIKDKTNKWDYLGVVVSSLSSSWAKGQVKYYFKKKSENKYWIKILNSFHKLNYIIIDASKSLMNEIGLGSVNNVPFYYTEYETYEINNVLNYIRIPTFDITSFNKLENTLILKNDIIKSKPYIILDLRGNTGEDEKSKNLLLNFFGIDFQKDTNEILVTNKNIKLLEDQINLNNKKSPIDIAKNFEFLNKIKHSKLNSFVQIENSDSINAILNLNNSKIQKIYILQDSKCAKACERFIQIAKLSGKAISFGEKTSGNIAYDSKVNYNTICGNLLSYSTSTNSKFIPYEIYGIKPNVASFNENLIEMIQKYLISN